MSMVLSRRATIRPRTRRPAAAGAGLVAGGRLGGLAHLRVGGWQWRSLRSVGALRLLGGERRSSSPALADPTGSRVRFLVVKVEAGRRVCAASSGSVGWVVGVGCGSAARVATSVLATGVGRQL